jgi:hypothetical protein
MDVDAYVADEEAHWEAESRTRGCIALSIHIVRAAMWIQSLPEHRETAACILAECDLNNQGLGEAPPVKSDLQVSHASSAIHEASFTSQSNSSASRIKTRRLAHTAAKLPALSHSAAHCSRHVSGLYHAVRGRLSAHLLLRWIRAAPEKNQDPKTSNRRADCD